MPIMCRDLASGNSTPLDLFAGQYVLTVAGTFDGATVKFQINPGDIGWVDDSGVVFNTPGTMSLIVPSAKFRLVLSSAGANTLITASIDQIKLFDN